MNSLYFLPCPQFKGQSNYTGNIVCNQYNDNKITWDKYPTLHIPNCAGIVSSTIWTFKKGRNAVWLKYFYLMDSMTKSISITKGKRPIKIISYFADGNIIQELTIRFDENNKITTKKLLLYSGDNVDKKVIAHFDTNDKFVKKCTSIFVDGTITKKLIVSFDDVGYILSAIIVKYNAGKSYEKITVTLTEKKTLAIRTVKKVSMVKSYSIC